MFMRRKTCTICGLNNVDTECYKSAVECRRDVVVQLDCGHDITWTCGVEEDPRTAENLQCQDCVRPIWDEVSKYEPSNDDIRLTLQLLKNKINILVHQLDPETNVIFLEEESEITKFKDHLVNGRNNILKKHLDYLRTANPREKKRFPEIPALPGTPEFADFYDITFIREKGSLVSKQTVYGAGIELRHLTQEALRVISGGADNGKIDIKIVVGFRHNILKNCPQFVPNTNNKKNKQKANREFNKFKEQGYDSVLFTNDSGVTKSVYWYAKQIVQFATAELKLHEKCIVCLDAKCNTDGYKCSHHHFLCWECMSDFIKASSSPGTVGRNIDAAGNIVCPKCNQSIAPKDIATAPGDIYSALEKLKIDTNASKRVSEALAEQEQRMKKEHERIMNIRDEDDRNAELLKLRLMNETLTLSCPVISRNEKYISLISKS